MNRNCSNGARHETWHRHPARLRFGRTIWCDHKPVGKMPAGPTGWKPVPRHSRLSPDSGLDAVGQTLEIG